MNKIKAVILARVSTLRQEEEGLSLDNQLNTLREYAKKNNFDVIKEFRFSESADSKIRSKFLEMISFVRDAAEIGAVIAFRVDRITRNYRDAVLIDDLRVNQNKEIHFVYDRLVIAPKTVGRDITDWDTKVYLAKQFLNRLKEDAVVSIRHKLRNGEWPTRAPFGYDNITNEDGKKWIAPNPLRSRIVAHIFEWYASGALSMDQTRKRLRDEYDLEIGKAQIGFILRNPFYHGEMSHGGQLYPHRYQTIIPKALYKQVQDVKAGYHKKPHKWAGLPYLYRGLITCDRCGCSVTPEKKKGRYVYYHCTQFTGKCGAKWVREESLTAQFGAAMAKISVPTNIVEQIRRSLRESHQDKVRNYQTFFDELTADHERHQKRIEKMYEDYLDGRITQTFYDEKREEYRAKQEEIQSRLKGLQKADEDYYSTAEYLLKLANRSVELFKSSEPDLKRQILKLLFQNCTLSGESLSLSYKRPFELFANTANRLDWLPELDSN